MVTPNASIDQLYVHDQVLVSQRVQPGQWAGQCDIHLIGDDRRNQIGAEPADHGVTLNGQAALLCGDGNGDLDPLHADRRRPFWEVKGHPLDHVTGSTRYVQRLGVDNATNLGDNCRVSAQHHGDRVDADPAHPVSRANRAA
jgi:hypothetical protein